MSLENILKVEINLKDIFYIIAFVCVFITSLHRKRKLQKCNLDKKLFREIFSLLKPDYIETIVDAIQQGKYSLNMVNDLLNYCKIKNYGHKYFYNKNIQKLKDKFDKDIDSFDVMIKNGDIEPSILSNLRNNYFVFYNQARELYDE